MLGLNLLVKPFWVFGIDRVVQNTVGSAEYGLYFSLFNLSIIFNILLDLGLTNFNNRNIARHNQLLPKYFSNIVVLKFLLAIVYAIITTTAGLIAGYGWKEFSLLFILMFNQFLLSFLLYLRSNISALHKFWIDSLLSITDRVLMIIIIGSMLWTNISHGQMHIKWFVLAQTFSYLTAVVIAFFIVLYHAKKITIKFNKAFLISTLKQTFPFALLVLLMSFYNRFDAVLLERLLPDGDVQAGIYAQSFRLLDALAQFSLLFANLLLPIFSKMLVKKENVSDLVSFSFFLLLTPAVIIITAAIAYNADIISLLYKEHNEFSSQVFAILICAFIPISTIYIFGTLLTANGNLKQLNIIAAISVGISISLNLILIPRMQAKGAAVTAVVTQSFSALLQMLFAIKILKIKVSRRELLNIGLFAILFFISTYLIHSFVVNWYIGFTLILIVGLIYSFIFRLISIKLIFQIMRGEEK